MQVFLFSKSPLKWVFLKNQIEFAVDDIYKYFHFFKNLIRLDLSYELSASRQFT